MEAITNYIDKVTFITYANIDLDYLFSEMFTYINWDLYILDALPFNFQNYRNFLMQLHLES